MTALGDPGGLLFGIGLYLVAIVAVGFVTWRRNRTLDDYVLAGRNLSPFSAALSERASGESGWFLVGLPGAAYVSGFGEFWTVIGSSFGIFFSWTLLARLLNSETRRLGALTIPDYLESRFDDGTRVLRVTAIVIILFFYTSYVAFQFNAAGILLETAFGLEPALGMLIAAAVVVLYTFMGGFLAVVWTDVVQGLLMAVVVVALPLLGLLRLQEMGGLVAVLESADPQLLTMSGGNAGWGFVNGVMFGGLMWGLGYLGQPHLLTRFMAMRRPEDATLGRKVAVSWVLLAYWGAAFTGIVAIGLLPGLEAADRERVMPLMATLLLPAWLAGLAIAGGIAAMMSTADSQLLVATSAVIEDIYVRLFRPQVSAARLVLLSRLATIGIAAVALVLAYRNQDFVFDSVEYAWTGLASSFAPVLLLGLRWQRMSRVGAMAGMVGGMVSTVIWKNVDGLGALLDIKLATFLIALLLAVLGSLLAPPRAEGLTATSGLRAARDGRQG
ncbi:MAG: sodium:proline symporter [Gemmatimonadota bacterium]|nr:MAG: sodium:proline symporter [Gemmatimonadota bacterium]